MLKSNLPVLVDFWAVWCAPCQLVLPALVQLAGKYKAKLKVVKLNVDENMKTSSQYSIMSIPALVLFKDGDVKETIVGALPLEKIEGVISRHL